MKAGATHCQPLIFLPVYIVTEHVVLCYEAEHFLCRGCLWEWGNFSGPSGQLCVTLAAAEFLESSCLESGKGVEK